GLESFELGCFCFGVRAVVVRRKRLSGRLGGTSRGLRRCVVGLALLVDERRNRDRGKNADDQDDDQKLDKGKTTLVLRALAQSIQHVNPPWDHLQGASPR